MAYQTLATADAILKDLYVGPVIEQLNYKTYMLDQIERDSDHVDFTGRRAIVPVHAGRNRKRGNISDGGTLPTPGYQTYDDAQIGISYFSQGISLTDQSIKQAKNNDGAFINLLDEETKMLAKDMKKDINRQVFNDANTNGTGSGLLSAITTGGVGAATITVASVQYIGVGDPVDILTRATGAALNATAQNRTVSSIAGLVVTLDSAITGTTDNTMGVYLAGSYGLEMLGLRHFAKASRTLHGIDSATNTWWNGRTRSAAGAVAGESLFEQLIDDVGAGGNGEVDVILTTRGIRRRLADTYQSQKRFNDANATKIHGGYSAIMVNEVPVIADDDVPRGYAFALAKDAFKWFEVEKPDWLKSDDGTVWQMGVSSTASGRRAVWESWMVWYASLACLAPNRIGAIPDAADDVASAAV